MFRSLGVVAAGLVALAAPGVVGCGEDSCYGPTNKVEHVRQVKRMQPGAPGAAYGPKGPLEWGQVNFLHTVCYCGSRDLQLPVVFFARC